MALITVILACLLLLPAPGQARAVTHRDAGLEAAVLDVPEKAGAFKRQRTLYARPGLRVSVFASGLGRARFMAVGPDGFIYLSVPSGGRVLVLPDRDGDGVADEVRTFAKGLDRPHGLAFRGKELVVAETGSLVVLKDTDNDLEADSRRTISADIPPAGGHWTRTVVEGPDKGLYVSVGSSCNVCEERDGRRAAVLRFPPEGGRGEVFARGLRNSVGIAFHPETGELWGVDNGRDGLGDDLPPEELNLITRAGDYGWPYCYGDRVPDPGYGTKKRCVATKGPEVEMQAHSAPLGIAFGKGAAKLPLELREVLFVAFHGSWDRSDPTGYKLVAVPFEHGRPAGAPFDVVTGWLVEGRAWGRPVAPLVGRDGALYLSDDYAGAVYRITGK